MSPQAIPSFLRTLFDAAIASAQPSRCVPQHLPPPPKGRLIVVGAGKASAAMAQAVEAHWPDEIEGLVITRYGYGVPCSRIEVVEAAHPVPDEAGLAATQRLCNLVTGLSADDLVLCLISGGGSSLLTLPAAGLTLADKQAINRALLTSGASISEMNCVRRHVSAIKGGRLAALCHPARVLTLSISDVPGDDPVNIASGPTVGDPSTCADALAVIDRYALQVPNAVRDLLAGGHTESVKPGDPRLAGNDVRMIATPQMALEAAASAARATGIEAHILGDSIEGEAREVGKALAAIAMQVARRSQPFRSPCLLLSGGETTVTVHGHGRGGRNVEFLLSLAVALDGAPGIYALAGDTDGVDGQEEVAGAIITPGTKSALMDAEGRLAEAERMAREIQALQPAQIIPRARELHREMVERMACIDDVSVAREAIKQMVGEITLIPGEGGLWAEMKQGGMAALCQISVVAGARSGCFFTPVRVWVGK